MMYYDFFVIQMILKILSKNQITDSAILMITTFYYPTIPYFVGGCLKIAAVMA